jgi:hypothetical protein
MTQPEQEVCKGINPLNAELNPICHLLALLGAHHILHVSRVRVNRTGQILPTLHLKRLDQQHSLVVQSNGLCIQKTSYF